MPSSEQSIDNEDIEFGFGRSEMYKSNIGGTVDTPYDRHLFLCYKSYDSWPARVESELLPKALSSALKDRKDDFNTKIRMTVSEGGEGTEFSNGDVLIFPNMIKYKGLKESDVDSFVEDVLVNEKPWSSGVQEVLIGTHVFVCAHASRDKRCGVCGPVLIQKFHEEIEERGLKDQVYVGPCSHIGGHKYAGNLIIFSPDLEGKIAGHWYGYVTPADIPELFDQHIGKGEVIKRLWRGQMGDSLKQSEHKSEKKSEKENKKKQKRIEETNSKEVTSCCQGANGFSCCKDETLKILTNDNNNNINNNGVNKLWSWVSAFDQADVLAGIAAISAVASVAVAYSLYKRP